MMTIAFVAMAIGVGLLVALAVLSIVFTPGRARQLRDDGAVTPLGHGDDGGGWDG